MSFNIMDLIKDQVSDQVMGQLGNVIGGNSKQNASAVSSAIPGLLSSLTNSGATESGAGSLFNAINDQDDSFLDNISDMLGGDNQSSLLENGTGMLGSLLGGGGLGGLVNAVSGFSGVKRSGASSLLSLLAPIVFSVIKRKLLGSGGLNVGNLMGMLDSQKDNVTAGMPSGFSQMLSGQSTISNVTETASNVAHETTNQGKSFLGRILPIALLAVAAFLAYNFFGGKKEVTTGAVNTGSVKEMAGMDAADITDKLQGTLGGLTSSMEGITDVATAEAAIPNIATATDSLGNLAGLMNKLPVVAQGPVKSLVNGAIPQINDLVERVSIIPGVGAVLQPVLGGLMDKLALFN